MGAVDQSHLEKVVLARKVGVQFNHGGLPEDRKVILHSLAMVLMGDVSAIVRQTLAYEMRQSSFVPRDVCEKIARDVEDVSVPFLANSPSITDDLMLDIIPFVEDFALTAMASRSHVSSIISEKLSEFGGRKTLNALLKNSAAEIPPHAYINIMSRHGKDVSLMELMAQRDLLPLDIVARLMTLVTDSMMQQLQGRYDISVDAAATLVAEARDKGLAFMMDGASMGQLVSYARDMRISNELTPTFILNIVRRGNKRFFVASMAVLVDRQPEVIENIIRKGRNYAIERLVKKVGFSDQYVKLFIEALE